MAAQCSSERLPLPSSQQRPCTSDIVTPPNRTATVWRHFGFKKDENRKLIKGDRALCKVCGSSVAHGGGTTNLRNHLRAVHSTIYYVLFPTTSTEQPGSSSKQDKVDKYFPQTDKIPLQSQRHKVLTEAVAGFITRPVNVVDGAGFLKLMEVAEPRYVVPCRKSVMKVIDQQYLGLKHNVHGELAVQKSLSLTTDMWTSRKGDGYISLTCHFLTPNFQMFHRNLTTHHLPGVHDHTNIAEAIQSLCTEWCIELTCQVSAFTTDNGSNIVKALNEDIPKIRIPCAGHTLNLSVHSALAIHSVRKAVARRKIVAHFNQSRLDREELGKKQKQLEIPQHSLVKDVDTRWNSTFDMIKRVCEQQAAIAAVLLPKRTLSHLELSSDEWGLLQDVAEVLEPFKDATVFLSGDSYPTTSVLGPLFNQIKLVTTIVDSDSTAVKEFKGALARDMNSRYQDEKVLAVLNKSSFLDPRFKTLAHLTPVEQQDTVDNIVDELMNSVGFESFDAIDGTSNNCEESPPKKPKQNLLEKMLGDTFESNNRTMGEATTLSYFELMTTEVSRYKSEPSLKLSEDPLKWWRLRSHSLSHLARIAQKYLGIVTTSTTSERLFSTAGNITAKRSALSTENVDKLVFLHENLPKQHLSYKRVQCKCNECTTQQSV